MGENNCKWSNWQRINLQNIQAAYPAWYQKNSLIKKKKKNWAKDLNRYCSKEDKQMANNNIKKTQHHSLLEKYKSKLQWGNTS